MLNQTSKWRNKKTGTVYASVKFNDTPIATVTTEAGATFNVHKDRLKPAPDNSESAKGEARKILCGVRALGCGACQLKIGHDTSTAPHANGHLCSHYAKNGHEVPLNAPDLESEPQDRANDEPVVQQATPESEELEAYILDWLKRIDSDKTTNVWAIIDKIMEKAEQWRTKSLVAAMPKPITDWDVTRVYTHAERQKWYKIGYNTALQDIKSKLEEGR